MEGPDWVLLYKDIAKPQGTFVPGTSDPVDPSKAFVDYVAVMSTVKELNYIFPTFSSNTFRAS